MRPKSRRDRAVILLLALTALALALCQGPPAALGGGAILLIIAIFKARLVVLDYFGFRNAPGPWSAILMTWIGLVAATALTPSIYQLLH